MDSNRKFWNEGHKRLRQALNQPDSHSTAMDLFLRQHAMVHRAEMSQMRLYSFADEVWDGANEVVVRCVPPKFEHSIAWIIWHLARIEDMTMNTLMVGKTQVFFQDNWLKKLNITARHSGNVVMQAVDVTTFSESVHLDALKEYRLIVGRATREAVSVLRPAEVRQMVNPARLDELLDNGSVSPEAMDLIEYWGNLTIAGLLLMPPTRHCLVHLNEAMRVKKACIKLLR